MATTNSNDQLQESILLMTQLLQRLAVHQATNPEQVLESLSTNISEFNFDPENGTTFEKWFARYTDLFESDARNLDDAAKVRLLLRKLDTASHSRYVNYILPKLPKDVTFADTVTTHKKIFGKQTSVFHKRYQCLQLLKTESDDIISYGGKVNRACEEFEFQDLKIDHFKCLIFVCGLKAPRYADIRARLLSRIESETIQQVISQLFPRQRGNNLDDQSFIHHQFKHPTHPADHSLSKANLIAKSLSTVWSNVVVVGQCFVTSSPDLNVLGIDWIDTFNLWSIPFDKLCNQVATVSTPCSDEVTAQLQAEHPAVFNQSLGHCNKTKVKLFLKPNAKPVFCSKRPVPFNTISLVDEELTRLQSLGIITPIDFSEWAAPIVAVRKPNGKVRICADYSTGLNEALEGNHYPLPTPEEIFAQLNGSVVFSIIDLSDAYLQVEVDEESKKLLTINTHRGLFQFNRLAPGVKSAPGAFQRLVDSMIADIPGVRTSIDDAIVFGPNYEAHKASLDMLLQRLEEYGFHVKLEKCRFFQTEISYLGHIADRNGIRPDPEKIQAIASIPAPTNVSELRSFLGAVNFYGRFVRNIHELRHPLDMLLKKNAKWQWNSDCQKSFERFKQVLQSDMLLTHYDPKLPIIVAADASSTGIGADTANQKKKL
ncbi:uncharacterized protein K02A2.6-like [Armigeres subalbatus]|uniref:uncharacterized protein K02A2.6-like n=1 Tax=Armigeres subalbatus TaxID=124917 RepID=UPI002ED0AD79